MAKLVLALNIQNGAVSQYTDFDFDTAVAAGKQPVCGNNRGLFLLESSQNDEAQINAHFTLPRTDMGSTKEKHARAFIVGGQSSGPLTFSFCADDREFFTKPLRLEHFGLKQGQSKIMGRRDVRGRRWQLRIANTNGHDFSIDAIDGLFIETPSK